MICSLKASIIKQSIEQLTENEKMNIIKHLFSELSASNKYHFAMLTTETGIIDLVKKADVYEDDQCKWCGLVGLCFSVWIQDMDTDVDDDDDDFYIKSFCIDCIEKIFYSKDCGCTIKPPYFNDMGQLDFYRCQEHLNHTMLK